MMIPKKAIPDVTVCGTRVRCWDDDTSLDRYTILYMSEACHVRNGRRLYPGMHSWANPAGSSGHLEAHPGVHLGKRISFHDLPESVRRMIRNDLNKEGDE